MPPRSAEPLLKITLNLFEADVRWMERRYGHGWTERVRNFVHDHRREKERPGLSVDEIHQIYADELEDEPNERP